jgi:hypothetical protein
VNASHRFTTTRVPTISMWNTPNLALEL